MIKSKEQFATIIMNLSMFERDASENSIYTMHIDELIESLRNVARAAQVINGELLHDEYEEPGLHALDTALATLPAWVLEDE
ncbi:hypothetical protein LCGC14_0660090 [marine sediment metagenome]|uniref:Uncharacterized protein n=1 Tax=marine sediment metagenome TaxID=412755 RepID=A0A0F9TF53_9ZZZZ